MVSTDNVGCIRSADAFAAKIHKTNFTLTGSLAENRRIKKETFLEVATCMISGHGGSRRACKTPCLNNSTYVRYATRAFRFLLATRS